MHTTSAFSVWSWLVLSILRYTAVFHPLKYRTIWRQPRDALKLEKNIYISIISLIKCKIFRLLVVVCCLCESWILLVVVYFPSNDKSPAMCAENPSIDQHTIKVLLKLSSIDWIGLMWSNFISHLWKTAWTLQLCLREPPWSKSDQPRDDLMT